MFEDIKKIWFKIYVDGIKYYPKYSQLALIDYGSKVLTQITKEV